jgi:hypothetical protein
VVGLAFLGEPKPRGARHFQTGLVKRLTPGPEDLPRERAAIEGSDVVHMTAEEIEQLLSKLDNAVPRLLKENQGIEFWIEYLQRADAIKEQAGLENYDRVATRIDAIPAKYGVLPPSHWMYG